MKTFILDPIVPLGVVVAVGLLLVGLTVAGYWQVSAALERRRRILLLLLRLAGLGLVLLLLLQPSRQELIPPEVLHKVTLVAVDNSLSMVQKDTAQGTRLQAAKSLLAEAELVNADGAPANREIRLFKFADSALPIDNTQKLDGSGTTTRFQTSLANVLGAPVPNETARALIVLSDGHDFELVNPGKTGFTAKARQIPIYAVAMGKTGKVRDVATRIIGYQPYCYAKQKARVSVSLRMAGCELETVDVQLRRNGTLVQSRKVKAGEEAEQVVDFDVTEPVVGQFEYEVLATPLEGETDKANNRAMTVLNVIDRQIQVLFLEGEPYWDTSFLQRSLMRNEKMNVDSIVQYAPGKARTIRKRAEKTELTIPSSVEDWHRYDVVVLGRSVEKLMGAQQLQTLIAYVKNNAGVVIFSRGPAFSGPLSNNELEPVIWSTEVSARVRLEPGREGQSAAPFVLLNEKMRSAEPPMPLIAGRKVSERKPLAAAYALVQPISGGEPFEAMIHRRFGEGQVFSIGLDGLWRWAFNAKVEGTNTLFDRFWDQMVLWLLAGREFEPTEKFSFRASSTNVPLGEKIHFRTLVRSGVGTSVSMPMLIKHEGVEVGRTAVTITEPSVPERLTGEFLPEKVGKYEASIQFPDGSPQNVRFIVYEENLEQTEVATDSGYLRRLCESSGGRLLEASQLGGLIKELQEVPSRTSVQTRLVSLWDKAWVFWTIGSLLALDWFLRRRWGLA